jgi:hypothetical protein
MKLDPVERLRRLQVYRELKDKKKLVEIASELGLSDTTLSTWLTGLGNLDEEIEAAKQELSDEDALCAKVVEAQANHKTRAAAANALGMSWGRFTRLLSRAADRGLDSSTPATIPSARSSRD